MQVVVLGSYSNALPREDRSSGQAQLMYCMSDEAAFGSVVAADWQRLPVQSLISLLEAAQAPLLGKSAVKPGASCKKHAYKDVLLVRCAKTQS